MEKPTVFFAISETKVMTALHLLEEAGIQAHKFSTMDSAHVNLFGDIQIIVNKEDEEKTRLILEQAEIL